VPRVNQVSSRNEKKEPLARSLGKFFGNVARGFTTDVSKPCAHEVKRTVEEETREQEDGKSITLRRTTIEEIEIADSNRERE